MCDGEGGYSGEAEHEQEMVHARQNVFDPELKICPKDCATALLSRNNKIGLCGSQTFRLDRTFRRLYPD